MFWDCLFRWKCNRFAQRKNCPKSCDSFGLLHQNHTEPPKVAQLVKNRPIWSPCIEISFLYFCYHWVPLLRLLWPLFSVVFDKIWLFLFSSFEIIFCHVKKYSDRSHSLFDPIFYFQGQFTLLSLEFEFAMRFIISMFAETHESRCRCTYEGNVNI
jgi:hypothetical protein